MCKIRGSKDYLEPKQATGWMNRSLKGNITRAELDDARIKEINGMDMMQNSTISYHPESIMEIQLMGLICFSYLLPLPGTASIIEDAEKKVPISWGIVYALIAQHTLSYFISFFRKWEIKYHGKTDLNGIIRGKVESLMGTIEVLVSSVICGYLMNYLIGLDHMQFHDQAFFHYWLIIDCTLMFTALGYVYLSKVLQTKGEITKNIFTLSFL